MFDGNGTVALQPKAPFVVAEQLEGYEGEVEAGQPRTAYLTYNPIGCEWQSGSCPAAPRIRRAHSFWVLQGALNASLI